MKYIKGIVFGISIILASYVGGIPTDIRNLFISQTIFFVPYLLDFYPLVLVKSQLKYITTGIFIVGIIVTFMNILGVIGILTIVDNRVTFHHDYFIAIPFNLEINIYLLIVGIVYVTIFIGTMAINTMYDMNKHFEDKKRSKGNKQKKIKQKDVAI